MAVCSQPAGEACDVGEQAVARREQGLSQNGYGLMARVLLPGVPQ
eukprot:CAMPEP_0185902534 /NCGR_PEP_ID=MMETSP0196C-20130402/1768_1 /TAXON_ID=2932 /ORGANISM="Alexandrium fundyense, Strain CCMP1719" /LENGTH=44 /DNA_ID= /DNA_START= /DNA_END= /DNA_ORIENTATION=